MADYLQIIRESREFGMEQVTGEWVQFMLFLDTLRPQNIVEIGSRTGGSAYTMAHFTERLVCIDIKDKFRPKKEIETKCIFNFIEGDSKDKNVIDAVSDSLGGDKISLLFIDGDHTYEGVKADFNNFAKLLQPNGVVVLHDIIKSDNHTRKNCFVSRLWDEIKLLYDDHAEIISGNKNWGGIGIVRIN